MSPIDRLDIATSLRGRSPAPDAIELEGMRRPSERDLMLGVRLLAACADELERERR